VAGRFYPGERRELVAMLDALFAEAGSRQPRPARGVLAPHAGYVYSGLTAARTYASCEIPERCLVLCPNHTGRGERFAIQSRGAWETPLGLVPVDEDLAARLLRASPELAEDTRAHEGEHAIEVHLPFLLRRQPGLRFVPICVGGLRLSDLTALGHAMGRAMADLRPRPLVVISSDMTHYEPADVARRKDRSAIAPMERVDAQGLYEVVESQGISMCGIAPATAALACLRDLGATTGHLVDYTNSGDRSGDHSQVVGYAGLTFS
jgi:AmmeMemoRadiSam system protein B